MVPKKLILTFVAVAVALPLCAQAADPIEPNAGNWRTWVISSGRDYRVPPPPGAADTQAELRALSDRISRNDAQILQQIAYWDAGAPAYRWIDLITARLLAGVPTTTYPQRVYMYVALAMHDATIATWESKYAYNRPRPSERDHKLPTAVTVPDSPSYPSEHAATAQAAAWKPLLISSPAMFRPPPPPACDSPQVVAETMTVHNFPRAIPGTAAIFATNYKAFYWQSPEGINSWPYRYADKWIAEDRLDRNPPRVARAYALIAASLFDAFIASQDGKFTYWYIRPSQLDPGITPLFPVPNFPSYPSNHSTFSATRSEILAYLFPTRADFIRAVGKEGGDSRIWAGIHFPMDNLAGVQLGKSVAQLFISRAQSDGSQ